MSISAYDFKHADGTTLGSVYTLEGNGPSAASVPLQIREIDFSQTPLVELIVDGDVTSRFATAVINYAAVDDYSIADQSIDVVGEFVYSAQLETGKPITLFNSATGEFWSGTITAAEIFNAGITTIGLSFPLPAGFAGWLSMARVSTVRSFDLVDGAYSGTYAAAEQGSFIDGAGNTHIRVNEHTPLATPSYPIVAVTTGANGSFTIEDSANGSAQFRVGSVFHLENNDFPGANGSYTVAAVETSGSYTITAVNESAKTITIAGDHHILFVNNKQISVSGGQAHDVRLTIASASALGASTVITTVEALPTTVVASNTLVAVPAMTNVRVTGNVPVGTGVTGYALPAVPESFLFSAPPAIIPTAANTFLITWRIAGNHAAKFTPGSPILVKNNNYYGYNEFSVQSVSFSADMTHIVTQVVTQNAQTPAPGSSGQLVYPAPAADFGYLRYHVDSPLSPLQLVGKGSPLYNATTTWGQAMQNNAINITENFRSGLVAPVTSVDAVLGGRFYMPKSFAGNTSLRPGVSISYSGDNAAPTLTELYTVASYGVTGNDFVIAVNETINALFTGGGHVRVVGVEPTSPLVGQLWYDQGTPQLMHLTNDIGWSGVLVQRVPAISYVDMGNQPITKMADPTNPQDAVNLQTGDRLYIAKTGGYSANVNTRSGSMLGSLNFGVKPAAADWSALGMNMSAGDITMYVDSNVMFDASSTGGVYLQGTGSVDVEQGHVQVGNGIDNYVTIRNNAGASPTITFTTATTGNGSLDMGLNKIVNLSTPSASNDAANKAYVDSLSNGIVWLQPVIDPNLFRDDLNTPPFITAAVVGVSTGATNYWKISGNFASSFAAGQVLTITDNTFPAANGSYVVVSAANNGGNTDVTVTASTIPVGATVTGNATDTSIPTHKTFIVGTAPTGAWAGLARHAVVYTVTNIDPVTQAQTWGWMDVMGRAVQVGDRFGVFVEPDAEDPLNILPAGGLVSSAGKIATVTNVSPLTYSFYTPTEPYAFSVTGVSPTLNSNAGSTKSPHFGHSYTFRGTYGSGSYGSNYKWIEFAGPSMFAAGGGLKYAGSVLNVGAGAGIIVNADTVQLDNTYASGIYVRLDGAYAMTGALKLGGNQINNVGTPTLSTDAANKLYADNQDALRVAKAGDTMSGTLSFTSGTVTGIAYPTANQDAASKVFVDNQDALRVAKAGDTMSGSLVMTGAGVGITLPNAPVVATDAVNKSYADSKLSLSGGTMIGALTLSANPVGNLDAAPKQYVDNGFVKVTASTSMNAAVNVTFTGGGEVLGLPTTPSTGSAATSKTYVDNQLALKATDSSVVHTSGNETINGDKTFNGVTTIKNNTIVSANGVNNNLAITASAVSLVGTPVNSGGASNITIAGGVNTGGIGGSVSLTGGNGSTIGGDITIAGGQGSAGQGGNITITTGIGSTTPGQLTLTAGSASLQLQTTGVWRVGGLAPTAKSQALCADVVNPTTASPTWQLVGTRVASAPANSAAPGVIGNWFADDSYFYVYGATGWRRIATTTF